MSLTPSAVSAPTRLRLPDLLHTTDRFADDVLRGRFTRLLPPGGFPADSRWFARLHSDDELDVWLINWKPGPPPLTAMSYYTVTADQRLRRTRTELTDASAGG
ncbi:MAG: hypothetical protein EBU23_06555 [Mycobacteriaceae bacterium]|nr:hypothetical protein [Mycobacteriaceae bacterium]